MKYNIPIRQLTDEFGLTTRALRFYEDQGLLLPERNGRNRIFSERDRTRLKLILRGKRMGFSLAEIRVIIDMYDDKSGELQQLEHLQQKIAKQRESLVQKLTDITDSLVELDRVEKGCIEKISEIKTN